MFATLLFDRDYPVWADVPKILETWVNGMGTVAIFVVLVLTLMRFALGSGNVLRSGLSGQLDGLPAKEEWKRRVFQVLAGVTVLGLAGSLGAGYAAMNKAAGLNRDALEVLSEDKLFSWVFFLTSLAATATLGWEFLLDLTRFSPRRLWAIARFSIVEAVRRKVLWSFALLLLVFLFASWFIPASRVDRQWSTYVGLVYFIMSALMLVTASVVACFSIPTDIKNLSIQTVVTKPVQRFEIVLGRILGLVLLMTAVLAVAVHLSLLYVVRAADEQVVRQATRARVPLLGALNFEELNSAGQRIVKERGDEVGREVEPRQYIRGASNQEAVWRFGYRFDDKKQLVPDPKFRAAVPRLLERDWITVEFTFDIFRTSKGAGDYYVEGVDVQFVFINRTKWDETRYSEYREAKDERGLPMKPEDKARKFGYYETPRPIRVFDERSEHDRLRFPAALLEGLGDGWLEVRVNCRSHSQYLGVHKRDLYILDNEANFYLNFLKGATGIWFFMVLAVTFGVIFSTYLNGPVSLMLVWLLLILGQPALRDFVSTQTRPEDMTNPGGGPLASGTRILTREAMTTPLPETRANIVLQSVDTYAFRPFFQALYRFLPDVGQFQRSHYVAQGFDIPSDELAVSFVLLLLNVLPYLLVGFFLINVREIAA
ncbi:MAG TPA: hypothetical protein PKC45_02465 [Gemmatales bacterium]|nr:hypothetical protein [Gemmatales bacterium]